MSHTHTSTSLVLTLALLLSACAYPETAGPATAIPAHVTTGPDAVMPIPDAWWQLFNDPILDALEQRVVVDNETLRLSLAQLAGASALLEGSQRANQPTLIATLGNTRAANAGSSEVSNTASLLATASWEPDVWGRLKQASLAAQAGVHAAESDLAAARLSVQANVAQTYVAMRSAEVQQVLLARNVQALEKALALTQARHTAGVAPLSDVLQASTQLHSTVAQHEEAAAQRALLEHAIAVLLGQSAASFRIGATASLPSTLPTPLQIPAELVQRRPDIAAAQQRVKAAMAQIGVTDAAWFPNLTLSANLGNSQTSLPNLLSTPNLLWSLGAGISQTLFDGGVRAQASAQARAGADQATAAYRQTILVALQEVEDNLTLATRLHAEVNSQTLAWQASVRNEEIVNEQYRSGTVSYLNVSAAQSTALSAEIALLSARTRLLNAINVLLKNIAGRWNAAADPA